MENAAESTKSVQNIASVMAEGQDVFRPAPSDGISHSSAAQARAISIAKKPIKASPFLPSEMCAEKETVKTVENVRAIKRYTNSIAFTSLTLEIDTNSTFTSIKDQHNPLIKFYHRQGNRAE